MIFLTAVIFVVALASGVAEPLKEDFIYTELKGYGHYKLVNTAVKWETARRVCTNYGGHLLILNSREEALAVLRLFPASDWRWLGFDDYSILNDFITLHGTTLEEAGYQEWAWYQPDTPHIHSTTNITYYSCGAMTKHGHLAVDRCNKAHGFICEKESPLESLEAVQRRAWVPAGYRAMGGVGFYRLHKHHVPWETARRSCEAEGAHLMVPNSRDEAAMFVVFPEIGGWHNWIGFDDYDGPDGTFVNFNGQQMGSPRVYSEWSDDMRTGHCGLLHVHGKLGTLHCNHCRSYICELYKPGEKSRFDRPRASSPPSNYTKIASSYYKVSEKLMLWESARRACQAEGTHLLVLNSDSEADVLNNPLLVNGTNDQWYHIGFDDFSTKGEYMWLDGSRLEDTFTVRNKIATVPEHQCGCANVLGLLKTCDCEKTMKYICEWEKPGEQMNVSLYVNGYRQMPGFGYYKVHRDQVPWETARRRCEAEGAHLMVVNSRVEATKVLTISLLPDWIWLGFDNFDNNGKFRTLLNTTLKDAGFEEWAAGQPANFNCGAIKTDVLLGTVECEKKLPYICELRIQHPKIFP